MQLREAEPERQRRDEQDPAADAEQPGEHAGRASPSAIASDDRPSDEQLHADAGEQQREEQRQRPVRRAAAGARCRAIAPTAAGIPTSAAAPGFSSPWKPYEIVPATAMIPIAASEVAIAGRSSQCAEEQQQRDDDDPAADAEERAEEAGGEPDQDERARAYCPGKVETERLTRAPGRAARASRRSCSTSTARSRRSSPGPRTRPSPDATRGLVRAARGPLRARRLRSAAGPEEDAAEWSASTGVVYVGEHGLGLDPRAGTGRRRSRSSLTRSRLAWEPSGSAYSVAFHFRTAEDEQAAVAELRRVAHRARRAGLRPRWGRKVLEVLPAGRREQGHGRARAARRSAGCGGRSTRATTPPISTPSAASTASSSRCGSRSSPTRGRTQLGEAADIVVGDRRARRAPPRRL